MKRSARVALVGAAAAGAGAAVMGGMARRRWSAAHDVSGGLPLALPAGVDHVITAPDGARLDARVAGPEDAGRTFVLAHCWTGDRRVWGGVSRRLVEHGHRVVLWDHRGHARSTVGSAGYTLEALGADVNAVLTQLDLHDVVLAGHSMGGMAAMAFFGEPAHERNRVSALGLVATACGGLSRAALGDRIAVKAIGHPGVARALASRRLGPALVRNTVGRGAVLSHLEAVRETFIATPAEARAGFLGAILSMDLSHVLPGIDVPALVVVGTRDLLTPPRLARQLVNALPRARLEVLKDAGHMLPLERPEAVAALLESLPERAVMETGVA